jgi:hypothetical protein
VQQSSNPTTAKRIAIGSLMKSQKTNPNNILEKQKPKKNKMQMAANPPKNPKIIFHSSITPGRPKQQHCLSFVTIIADNLSR